MTKREYNKRIQYWIKWYNNTTLADYGLNVYLAAEARVAKELNITKRLTILQNKLK